MTGGSTQAILTLFIGETYLEAALFNHSSHHFFDAVDKPTDKAAIKATSKAASKTENKATSEASDKSTDNGSTSQPQLLWGRQFYLPHTSLKAALTQISKESADKNWVITKIYLVTRYLERLQNFRLGGSVAQYIAEGFEGHFFFANSLATSIVNPSLVISKMTYELSEADLQDDLQRLKKLNSECDKIVIHQGSGPFKNTEPLHAFFKAHGFTTFAADLNAPSDESRRSLFAAGVYGTISELFSELNAIAPQAEIFTWFSGRWNRYDEAHYLMEQSVSIYFSGQDFLWNHLLRSASQPNSSFAHFDFDHWEQFQLQHSTTWLSPWGPIQHKSEYRQIPLPVSPKQEVVLDETGRLQIQKPSMNNESGPLLAGRSNRLTVLDLFADLILENDHLHKMVGSPERTSVLQKTWAQFAALEKAQSKSANEISSAKLKNFVRAIIQVHTSGGLFDTPAGRARMGACGQLGYLFSQGQNQRQNQRQSPVDEKKQSQKVNEKNSPFFWSDSILDSLKRQNETTEARS